MSEFVDIELGRQSKRYFCKKGQKYGKDVASLWYNVMMSYFDVNDNSANCQIWFQNGHFNLINNTFHKIHFMTLPSWKSNVLQKQTVRASMLLM